MSCSKKLLYVQGNIIPLLVKLINFIFFKAFNILLDIKTILLFDKSKISKLDKPNISSIWVLISIIPLHGSNILILLFFKEIFFKLFFKESFSLIR